MIDGESPSLILGGGGHMMKLDCYNSRGLVFSVILVGEAISHLGQYFFAHKF